MAMALNPDDIADMVIEHRQLFIHAKQRLNNIFTTGDTRHFGIITQSTHANTHIDLSQLEDYYEVPMNNGERTGANVVSSLKTTPEVQPLTLSMKHQQERPAKRTKPPVEPKLEGFRMPTQLHHWRGC